MKYKLKKNSGTYSMWPKVLPHVNKNPYIINQNRILKFVLL